MDDLMREYLIDLQSDVIAVLTEYTQAFGATSVYQYHPLTDALGRVLDCIAVVGTPEYDHEICRESTLFAVNVMREYRNELLVRVVSLRQQDFYEDVISLLTEWRRKGWIALYDESAWGLTEQGRRVLLSSSAA